MYRAVDAKPKPPGIGLISVSNLKCNIAGRSSTLWVVIFFQDSYEST